MIFSVSVKYWLLLGLGCALLAPAQAHTYVVDQQHPRSRDTNPGTFRLPFRTISRGAALAGPGDTVLVRAGTYRERVAPARGGEAGHPVVYRAAPGEVVYIKGSDRWQPPWRSIGPGLFEGDLPAPVLTGYNPYAIVARRRAGNHTLGQVVVDGQLYTEVDTPDQLARSPGSWRAVAGGRAVQLHPTPVESPLARRLVELTVREQVFAPHQRGLGYVVVEGFFIEHAANQFPSGFWDRKGALQAGAVSTRSGHHWVIRRNQIHRANSIGLDCGSEGWITDSLLACLPETGYHQIEQNVISDNGACGLAGYRQRGTRICYNELVGNNSLGWTAPETGGIKVHFFYDGVIEGNGLRDNDCAGIWLDNVWYGSRVSRNVVLSSTGAGIFVEMGEGPLLVDNNVVAFTKQGEGIYLHDASGVTIAHNLFYANAHFGLYMRIVTERMVLDSVGQRVRVATRGQRVINNVFIDNYRGQLCWPLPDGDRVRGNQSDYNVFVAGTAWNWEGVPRQSVFALNTNDGRLPTDSLRRQWARLALPTDTLALPLLTLTGWQQLTGQDTHSAAPSAGRNQVENGAVARGAVSLSARGGPLVLQTGDWLWRLSCPPVRAGLRDLYGRPRSAGAVLPGPFTHLKVGQNTLSLQPVDAAASRLHN